MPKFFLKIFQKNILCKRLKQILCCLIFSNDYQTKNKEVFLEQIQSKDKDKPLPHIFIATEDRAEEITKKFEDLVRDGKKTEEGEEKMNFLGKLQCFYKNRVKGEKLTYIDFSGNKLGHSGAKNLAEILKANKTWNKINISGTVIEDSGAKLLAEALKNNTTLTEIDLSENKIGPSGAKDLAEALKSNKTLEKIKLWKNQIGALGAKYLAEALKSNKTLKKINLSKNEIGDSGTKEFAELLKFNTTLTKINLSENGIGDSGAVKLAESLVNKNGSSRNVLNSWKALTSTQTTIKINLSGNKMGVLGAIKFAEALQTNTTLTRINLSGNEIEDSGAKLLAKALKINTTLKEINLSENKIGPSGAKDLAEALKSNKTLEKINLSGNKIGVLGAKEFAEALQFKGTLTNINLRKCEIRTLDFSSTDEMEESKSDNLLKSLQSLKIPDHRETNTLLHSNSKLTFSELSFQDKASKETNVTAQINKKEELENFYAFIKKKNIPLLQFAQIQKGHKLGHSESVYKGSYLNCTVAIKEDTNLFDCMNKKIKDDEAEPTEFIGENPILLQIQEAISLALPPFNHCAGISLNEEDGTLYSVYKLALNDKLKEDTLNLKEKNYFAELILSILLLLDTDKIVQKDLKSSKFLFTEGRNMPMCDFCPRRKIQSEDSFDPQHSPPKFYLNYSEICTLGAILHEMCDPP